MCYQVKNPEWARALFLSPTDVDGAVGPLITLPEAMTCGNASAAVRGCALKT